MQAVGDSKTDPPGLLLIHTKAYSITALLFGWVCIFFFIYFALTLQIAQRTEDVCFPQTSRLLSVCIYLYVHVKSMLTLNSWLLGPCLSVSLLHPFTFLLFCRFVCPCVNFGGYKPCYSFCSLRQPEAAQLIHRQLPDLFELWTSVPMCRLLVLSAAGCFLSLYSYFFGLALACKTKLSSLAFCFWESVFKGSQRLLTPISPQHLTAPQTQLHSRLIGRIIMDFNLRRRGIEGVREHKEHAYLIFKEHF